MGAMGDHGRPWETMETRETMGDQGDHGRPCLTYLTLLESELRMTVSELEQVLLDRQHQKPMEKYREQPSCDPSLGRLEHKM